MALNQDILISVVTVIYNDADIIETFIQDTQATLAQHYRYYELLLVDNGSTDESSEHVQRLQQTVPNLRLLRLSRKYHQEIAMLAGLDSCLGDYIVIMEVEYDPPSLIPYLIEQAINGYEVVIARRTERQGEPILQQWLIRLFYKIAGLMLGYPLPPHASYFRVLSRQVVNAITKIRNKNRSLKYFNALVGFRQTHVPYSRAYRRLNKSPHRNLRQDFVQAVDILISNSAVPLRLATLLGLIASFLSLAYLIYVFVIISVKEQIAEGWISTSMVNTTLFFFLFLILTVLSEYVTRILNETKDSPLYFIEYETHSIVSSFENELTNRLNVV